MNRRNSFIEIRENAGCRFREQMRKLSCRVMKSGMCKEAGIDGILVTVGLCIIALLLCVVMKDSLTAFIHTIVTELTNEAKNVLSGVTP